MMFSRLDKCFRVQVEMFPFSPPGHIAWRHTKTNSGLTYPTGPCRGGEADLTLFFRP